MSSLHKFFITAASTLFGAGRSPIAPGTVGTLVATIPFLFWSPSLRGISIMTGLSFVLGLYASEQYAALLQQSDPSVIVIDELCGLWTAILTCYLLEYSQFGSNGRIFTGQYGPYGQYVLGGGGSIQHDKLSAFKNNALYLLAIFCAFRACDIIKPFPVSFFDKNVAGGLGIMMDDVVAGIMAGMIIYIVAIFW